jgi:hypothetical protein
MVCLLNCSQLQMVSMSNGAKHHSSLQVMGTVQLPSRAQHPPSTASVCGDCRMMWMSVDSNQFSHDICCGRGRQDCLASWTCVIFCSVSTLCPRLQMSDVGLKSYHRVWKTVSSLKNARFSPFLGRGISNEFHQHEWQRKLIPCA